MELQECLSSKEFYQQKNILITQLIIPILSVDKVAFNLFRNTQVGHDCGLRESVSENRNISTFRISSILVYYNLDIKACSDTYFLCHKNLLTNRLIC